MDAPFKKLASEAGSFFSRAKQYTEEALGGSSTEKTPLDPHLEQLLQRADATRNHTERIVKDTEGLLQPNPSARLDKFVNDALERKSGRLTESEGLGTGMMDAGNDLGGPYGAALARVGRAEQQLGAAEKEFLASAMTSFVQPLRAFLDGDMKTIQKERRNLSARRLDLDAARGRHKRAEQAAGGPGSTSEEVLKAESDVRNARSEFERQAEVTRLLLEGMGSAHNHHLRCLHDFVDAQHSFYAQCERITAQLQRELASCNLEMAPPVVIGNDTNMQ